MHRKKSKSRHLPSSIEEKDINDMVLAGHDVMDVLKCNTFSGLEAKLNSTPGKKYEQRYKGS